ncbi:MAG: pyridoxamine 5'-phosphate oxidase family protein [Atopobiaceae bacterium]|nr:pyridoxamine 5'-phosphate oxidase family protein [Atopobiaceae bacterium]
MFREMRRAKQQLSREEAWEIIRRGNWGCLAVLGDDGYPYTVPLNHVVVDNTICFHSAKAGHKLDAISACNKASYCVVDADDVVPEEYTSYFRSAIAFGRISVVDDEAEKQRLLELLGDRFNPNQNEALTHEIAKFGPHCHILRLEVEHISAKEAKELAMMRTGKPVQSPLDANY